jgi:hypothetical protein
MNARQEHYETHDRPESVRPVLDTEERVGVRTGYSGHPDPARPGDVAEYSATTAPENIPRDGGAGRVGLLNDVAGLRDEWQRVQGMFVDDPPRAVHEAGVLVDRTLDEIRMNVGSGHTSETMSTEDLRVSFQRYREFFQRLLSA